MSSPGSGSSRSRPHEQSTTAGTRSAPAPVTSHVASTAGAAPSSTRPPITAKASVGRSADATRPGNSASAISRKRDGTDPERHAAAFDAKVKTALDDGSYVDPKDANTTFKELAEDWRKTRTHDVTTAARIERELRLHVYPFDWQPLSA